MNAIDTEGNPIPGLYVVGNDSGGYFANMYPNLVTGMACGRTVTCGRLVGLHLAKMAFRVSECFFSPRLTEC